VRRSSLRPIGLILGLQALKIGVRDILLYSGYKKPSYKPQKICNVPMGWQCHVTFALGGRLLRFRVQDHVQQMANNQVINELTC
jgi:hypothetical protein